MNKIGRGKYIRTPEIRKKMSESHMGNDSYWKNKKRLDMKGEKHPLWKGESVSYSGLHNWLYRELGIADKCDNLDCIYPRKDANGNIMKKPQRFEWANISKQYKRDVNDFVSLCASCHQKWDLNRQDIRYEKNTK